MNSLTTAPWKQNPYPAQPPGFRYRCGRNFCAEVDWIESVLKHDLSRSILSVCSGHCPHTPELARRGYRIVSIDLSKSLPTNHRFYDHSTVNGVEVIRSQIDCLPLANLPDFDFCITSGVFSVFERDDQDLFLLRQLAGSLKPGGQLLLTAPNAAYLLAHQPQALNPLSRRSQPVSDDPNPAKINCPQANGRRWYTTLEINWLLNRVGMCPQRFFTVNQNGFNLTEQPGKDSEGLGVLAVKPGK